jgi:excinuclease ABC subunit C
LSDFDADFDAKARLQVMSQRPGVYRMLDDKGEVLYVGKARNLKKRVSNYFRASGLDTKTMALVSHIADIDVTITNSEAEALLLEQNLIKKYRPPYNIQLRDDKTYPYIMLTHKDAYPRLAFYRGSRKRDATFFGPYPSASAVRESLALLQKVFRVRQCEDSYFRNRSRPCLQYQIGRCTAPCVGYITPTEYSQDVQDAVQFLQGRSDALIQTLGKRMEQKSAALEFEQAARIRDRIADLRRIQSEQVVSGDGNDADVMAAVLDGAYTCVHVMTIRGGRIIGSRNFFPKDKLAENAAELLSAFIAQYYLRDNDVAGSSLLPAEIIISPVIKGGDSLQEALSTAAGKQIRLTGSVRAHRARWLTMAVANAEQAMLSHINNKQTMFQRFERLQAELELDFIPKRIECFDISHTMGESTVASCVAFDHNGPLKSDYRRYNISGIEPGDDYAAMDQVLGRRFALGTEAVSVPLSVNANRQTAGQGGGSSGTPSLTSPPPDGLPGSDSSAGDGDRLRPPRKSSTSRPLPDILLIDGGKGQLSQAVDVLNRTLTPEQLQSMLLIGIAKGISRRAGQETLFLAVGDSYQEIAIPAHSPALHLLQQVRDEAHRFAITGHRQRRAKTRNQSPLEQIPGLGPARRRELLKYFGGQQEIMRASQADLARTPGISKKLAAVIYESLHNE